MAGHSLRGERLLRIMFGPGRSYPEPLLHQVMAASRLADKGDREWARARLALEQYAEHANSGNLAPLIAGVDDLENFVITLARLLKVHSAVLKALGPRDGRSLVITGHDADDATGELAEGFGVRLDQFRNRIAHGDQDLEEGRAGRGFPTGIVEVRELGIAIQNRTGGSVLELGFQELATALSGVRRHLLDVIQR